MTREERAAYTAGTAGTASTASTASTAGAAYRLNRPSDSTDRMPSLREKAKAMYREAVLAAAEQVFTSQGIRGARIQDIAQLAGVSVGTVYNHFAQKEDIIVALAAKHDIELREVFDACPGDPTDFAGAFRARHKRMMRFMHKHIGFYTLALQEGLLESDLAPPNTAVAKAREATERRVNDVISELLEQGMREGVVVRQSTKRLIHFFTGAIRGVLTAAVKDPNLDIVEEGQASLELFLRAVRPDREEVQVE